MIAATADFEFQATIPDLAFDIPQTAAHDAPAARRF
jgi:hypothetical protein